MRRANLITAASLAIILAWVAALVFMSSCGCATTPPGYTADTTPGDDGSSLIGGTP